jgi:hypothetical protein
MSDMQVEQIDSFAEFVELCTNGDLSCGHVVYRGVSDADNHDLIPGIGRIPRFSLDSCQPFSDFEQEILHSFRLRARGVTGCEPKDNWEWLALAQHHGVPTRLLDWTTSPLVALYFATEANADFSTGELSEPVADFAAVYALHVCSYIDTIQHRDPFRFQQVGLFLPPHVSPRIFGQDI